MKVIFLDIDGVLNCSKFFELKKTDVVKSQEVCKDIDISKVRLLKEIIDTTDAIVVLSSSWRVGYPSFPDYVKLEETLSKYGVEIVDVTPPSKSDEFGRGNEIRRWLQEHKEDNITHFVILDDDSDMCEFTVPNLVKTSWYGEYENAALQPHHVRKAIEILGGKVNDKAETYKIF